MSRRGRGIPGKRYHVLDSPGPGANVRCPRNVPDQILLRGGLLVLRMGGEAFTVSKTDHARRYIHKAFEKFVHEGLAVNHFAELYRFPRERRGALEDAARPTQRPGRKSDHTTQ